MVVAFLTGVAGGVLRRGPVPARQPRAAETVPSRVARAAVTEGLRLLIGNVYLRALTLHAAVYNLAAQVLTINLMLWAVQERQVSPGGYGLALSVGGVGAVLGTLTALRLADRLGFGPAFAASLLLSCFVPLTDDRPAVVRDGTGGGNRRRAARLRRRARQRQRLLPDAAADRHPRRPTSPHRRRLPPNHVRIHPHRQRPGRRSRGDGRHPGRCRVRHDRLGSVGHTHARPAASVSCPMRRQQQRVLPLLLAAAALVRYVRHEERAADPLLPLGLLRSRPVAGANLTALAITASTTPAMYFAVFYVQDVLGVPAGRASLLFPAVNLAVIAGSLAGPRLLGRLGARRTALAGFIGIAIGITILMALPSGGLPVAQLLSAFILIGAGLGIASVASTQTGTDAAEPALRGIASGVLNYAAQVGTAAGVALLVPLAAATGSTVMAGYRIGFLGAIAVALGGAVSSFLLPIRLQKSDPAMATKADYLPEVGGSKRLK